MHLFFVSLTFFFLSFFPSYVFVSELLKLNKKIKKHPAFINATWQCVYFFLLQMRTLQPISGIPRIGEWLALKKDKLYGELNLVPILWNVSTYLSSGQACQLRQGKPAGLHLIAILSNSNKPKGLIVFLLVAYFSMCLLHITKSVLHKKSRANIDWKKKNSWVLRCICILGMFLDSVLQENKKLPCSILCSI